MPRAIDAHGPIDFDHRKVGEVEVPLGDVEGYRISKDDLFTIFGIDEKRFPKLPKRFVVPVLEGSYSGDTYGHLYLMEPLKWIPRVTSGKLMPKKKFTRTFTEKLS
jgi:hypothetical protein